MHSEIKIIKFDKTSLDALNDLTAAIKISNQVTQNFVDDFLAALRLENVQEMEGGEFEDVGDDLKPPNGL